VQKLVLRRVAVKHAILCLDRHHQRATETDALEEFAERVHYLTSLLLWNSKLREFVA